MVEITCYESMQSKFKVSLEDLIHGIEAPVHRIVFLVI